MNKFFTIIIIVFSFIPVISCSGKSNNKSGSAAVGISTEKERLVERVKELSLGLPEDIRLGIIGDIDRFLEQLKPVLNLPEEIILQADKSHSLGADYTPEDLVNPGDYTGLSVSRNNLSLREIIISDLQRMSGDAWNEGLILLISSTYRSFDYQDRLFKWNVEQNGLETAERESARPGTSQHQLGTAIDFGSITDEYAFTPAGKWLLENGWRYGFTLSYPDGYEWLTGYRYECWHFRYITPSGAKLQKEYFGDIQHYMISFLNTNREELEKLLKAD